MNRQVADSFETLIELTYRDVLQRNPEANSRNITFDTTTRKSGCC